MNIFTDTYSFRNNQFNDSTISNAVHDLFTLDESTKFQSPTIQLKAPEPTKVVASTPVKESFSAQMEDSIKELYDAYSYNMNKMMDDCNKKFNHISYEKYVNMFLLFILFILIVYIHSKMSYMHKLMKYTVLHQKEINMMPSFPV